MNMQVMDREDRRAALDAFANNPKSESTSLVPSGVFASPAERVFGAQPVAVKRDEGEILSKLRTLAAAAGEDFYYRFPVKKKVVNDVTGKEEWQTDYIEGPSIKCANNVARLYGNCDVDTRVFDFGDSYMFYARFMDLETGYSLTRPFRQRKGQKVMKTDAGRAEDIVFQIGASKAIRNVINNALEFFTNYAADEAKNSIIEKVGKRLDFYRTKVVERLADIGVDLKRVELVRGRAMKDWIAADVARTIAEIQAITDGMATAEETYPIPGVPIAPDDSDDASKSPGLDKFADGKAKDTNTETSQGAALVEAEDTSAGGPAAGQPAPEGSTSSDKVATSTDGASGAGAANAGKPKTQAEYIAHANAWRDALTDADAGDKQWKAEKALRNDCNVDPEIRDQLKTGLDKKLAELRGKKG